MDKYKQLRTQVSKKKATEALQGKAKLLLKDLTAEKRPKKQPIDMRPVRASAITAEKEQVSGSTTAKPDATLAEAVEELKKFIHSELNALMQELKRIQKSK